MKSEHISITGQGSTHQGQLRNNIDTGRRWLDDSNRLKGVFDVVAAGGNWEELGLLLGLPADEAEAVYNLLSSAVAEVSKTAVIQYLARLG